MVGTGVHRHAANEKGRTAKLISRIGHHGAEGESRKLARMRRQAADAAKRGERARSFGKGGFRNVWRRRSRAGMLSGRHDSMVAKVSSRLKTAAAEMLRQCRLIAMLWLGWLHHLCRCNSATTVAGFPASTLISLVQSV